MTYHFSCIQDDKGYWGKCLEFPHCATEGATKQEFTENCQEALDLYLDDFEDVIEVTPSRNAGCIAVFTHKSEMDGRVRELA